MSYQEKPVGSQIYRILARGMRLADLGLCGRYRGWLRPAAVRRAVPLCRAGPGAGCVAVLLVPSGFVVVRRCEEWGGVRRSLAVETTAAPAEYTVFEAVPGFAASEAFSESYDKLRTLGAADEGAVFLPSPLAG